MGRDQLHEWAWLEGVCWVRLLHVCLGCLSCLTSLLCWLCQDTAAWQNAVILMLVASVCSLVVLLLQAKRLQAPAAAAAGTRTALGTVCCPVYLYAVVALTV